MKYLKKSFSVAPGSGASEENWERTFGKKSDDAFCPTCKGTGKVPTKDKAKIREALDHLVPVGTMGSLGCDIPKEPCHACGGDGRKK